MEQAPSGRTGCPKAVVPEGLLGVMTSGTIIWGAVGQLRALLLLKIATQTAVQAAEELSTLIGPATSVIMEA
jgi:hypothetical protein